MFYEPIIRNNFKPYIKKLSQFATVHNYWFKFSWYKNKFDFDDILFDNAKDDIHQKFKNLDNIIIIALGHAASYGLYYVD